MTAPHDLPLLTVRDLHVSFPKRDGAVTVLDGVSFDVWPREILGIVGESGCGKSMTSLAIMGLIEARGARVAGSIRFRGTELVGLPATEMRRLRGREIAMIFQDPMTALTPVLTIGAQIDEALVVHQRLTRRGARSRTIELLDLMGIPDPARVAGRYPHQLSGGMRQRALIAMALSCNPSLLIADEPTTALDVTVQAQILALLERLRAEWGSAIMLITHDMGVIGEVTDRAMVMYSGTVVERGRTAPMLARPHHPYTWGLLRSIPSMEGERPRRLPSIDGAPPPPDQRPAGCPYRPRCPWQHDRCKDRPRLVPVEGSDVACVLPREGRAALVS